MKLKNDIKSLEMKTLINNSPDNDQGEEPPDSPNYSSWRGLNNKLYWLENGKEYFVIKNTTVEWNKWINETLNIIILRSS